MNKEALRRWEQLRGLEKDNFLILFNDEFNTFEHVIKSLVEICGHDSVQAEQCTILAHYKGSCEVRSGNRKMLENMQVRLKAKGLEAIVI
jgi:ATP-dependent Clp protease adaptor protein ClpS